MHFNIKSMLVSVVLLTSSLLSDAQIEVAHIQQKGFSSTGFGGFFNFGIPISDAADITLELGLISFSSGDHSVAIAPILAGYRYTLNQTGAGFYLEPCLGYTIGSTDIPKSDKDGNVMYNNDGVVTNKANGITSGSFCISQGKQVAPYDNITDTGTFPLIREIGVQHYFPVMRH
jgi:hypothetical protein